MMRRMIRDRILAKLPSLATDRGDACEVGRIEGRVVMTTDSFVVTPHFFPGGDIGSMAIYGTVNDLAVAGAQPLWMTLSLILEEGLPWIVLDRVLDRVALAAEECNVRVVAGDTKVVGRGQADGLYLNTCGLGCLPEHAPPGPRALQIGDRLLVSGPIGRHGVAILAAREHLDYFPPPQSDSAPVHQVTRCLQEALGSDLRAMRDATRGGVSAVLHEWSEECGHSMKLVERALPVTDQVRGVCELLGLDPLYVANEGTIVAAVARDAAEKAIEVLKTFSIGQGAALVGEVIQASISPVVIQRLLGRIVAVDEPTGAPLPRIC
jgi:hydrogenase expression/formation protein HypE